MSTQKQKLANRRNSQASTGPKTAEGKARSSFNAVKHGLRAKTKLLPGEQQADYERLRDGALKEFQPANAYEEALVEIIVDYLWWCSRQKRFEENLLSADFADTTGSIDKLLKVIEVLSKISLQEYEHVVGMHQIVQEQADYLTAGIQPENSPKASPLQSAKKEAVSGGEASKTSLSPLSLTALDEATRCLCRNERFFTVLARYSTSKHNRFVAAVKELRNK